VTWNATVTVSSAASTLPLQFGLKGKRAADEPHAGDLPAQHRDLHDVYPVRAVRGDVLHHVVTRRAGQFPSLRRGDRVARQTVTQRRARLHLDEYKNLTLLRDNVDLSERAPVVPCQDPVAGPFECL